MSEHDAGGCSPADRRSSQPSPESTRSEVIGAGAYIERWECSTGCEWDGSETPPNGPHRYYGEWCHETPKLVRYVRVDRLVRFSFWPITEDQ